ncbi:hypothetical protein B6V75_00390 [Thioclava sp. F1Mire-8]|uniref:hypothetical protein n=1 Tax=Thioclava sp. F1Mire-8 TaxID=1973006 RepID=UPI000B54452B|nr:hypothetical protein [Thioclava sp. F1Mire-8]OWY04648.1 hypothetical protein B6V75_00390 [Thioclava sp. F1Mire-8]
MANDHGKRLTRLQIMVSDDEIKALDDWRFSQRMPSRAAAIRELLRRGLGAEGYIGEAGKQGDSSSFGVIDVNPDSPTSR